jgi:hypothetical protein
MHRWICTRKTALIAGLAVCLVLPALARAEEGWGTIKGQIVYGGDVPERKKLNVDKDQQACLKNGPLYSESLVVDSKTKGVRWVVIYLADEKDPTRPLPLHPSVENIAKKNVEMDQPCCMFEPHVAVLRQGQTLVVKNSAEVSHNVHLTSLRGPNLNQIVPPSRQLAVPNIKASPSPISVKCDIHTWMQAWVFVVAHPYFAVTAEDGTFEIKNAPAGTYRLIGWNEGWVLGDTTPNKKGKQVTIKDGEVTDLGKVTFKKP